MWSSFGVVVDLPCFDDLASLGEVAKDMFVQAFVAQAPVEAFKKAFCIGLPGAM